MGEQITMEEEEPLRLVTQHGTEITLPQLPAIVDETAARTIRYGAQATEGVIKLSSFAVRTVGFLGLAAYHYAFPAVTAEEQALRERLTPFASAIGFMKPIDASSAPTTQSHHPLDGAYYTLKKGSIVHAASQAVGVFGLASERDAVEAAQEVDDTASQLVERMGRWMEGIHMAHINPGEPARMSVEATPDYPVPGYDAVWRTAQSFKKAIEKIHGREVPHFVLGALFVTSPRALEVLGIQSEHLRNGDLVSFRGPRKKVHDYALQHIEAPQLKRPEQQPAAEPPLPHPIEDNVPRQRFKRPAADSDPRTARQDDTSRAEPVEV